MKKYIFLLTSLYFTGTVAAQISNLKTYKTGIYVFCGRDLPKAFSYKIERKSATDTGWQQVANVEAPQTAAQAEGSLLTLPAAVAQHTAIWQPHLAKLWQQFTKAQTLDSLYAFAADPRYQATVGCGWFDDGLSAGTYQYRVSKTDENGRITMLRQERATYPSGKFSCLAQPVSFQPEERTIRISYQLSDTIRTAGVKLFRSKYLENRYAAVSANLLYLKEDGRMVAQVTDDSPLPGLTYSYFAVPYDALGNEGDTSDVLNIYNVKQISNVAIIQRFDATADEQEQGILLKWKLKANMNVSFVEVYRAREYDGSYEKVGTVSTKDTSYFDGNGLLPATSYYYYLVAQNGYGSNLPSARVAVILKGTDRNVLPPQHLSLSKKGNVVTLQFTRLEKDTRGYYVYRANGYTAPLKQLPRMVLSEDSLITFTDTLPLRSTPETYSYAVADVNTSYNISPVSERVSTQTSGIMPIPTGVNTLLLNTTKVFVTWKNVSGRNAAVSTYKVFRTILDANDKEVQASRLIATISSEANSLVDSSITEGNRYRYQVQSVGADTTDRSSLSNVAGLFIPENKPLPPGQVTAIATPQSALLQWDMPADNSIQKTRIYRALANEKPVLIKELNAGENLFEDKAIAKNKYYYYTITTVNTKNKESKPTDAVSVKIRS